MGRICIIASISEFRLAYESDIRNWDPASAVSSYANYYSALRRLTRDDPEVVVVDLTSLVGGTAGLLQIRKVKPSVKILVVSMTVDAPMAKDAFESGALGFVLRDSQDFDLLSAIQQMMAGGAPMSPPVAHLIARSFHRNPRSPLTRREAEVMQALSEGKTFEDIGNQLGISKDTVKTHVKHIYDKLQVNNKSDALRTAKEKNLV